MEIGKCTGGHGVKEEGIKGSKMIKIYYVHVPVPQNEHDTILCHKNTLIKVKKPQVKKKCL